MSTKILVAYASAHGQTRLVSEIIAKELETAGLDVRMVDALDAPPPPPDDFAAVLLGSRVHGGRHAKAIERYARAHRSALAARRCGFFSVSMAASDPDPGRRAEADAALERFLADTGLRVEWRATFAGALRYRSYPWYLKIVMRWIARRAGRPTDTRRDHDYTDYDAVGRFAARIADDLGARLAAGASVPSPPPRSAPDAPRATP